MKNILAIAILACSTLLFASSCSTCYECEEDVVITDNSGNPIDTTSNSEELCTADREEITDREDDGAVCVRQ